MRAKSELSLTARSGNLFHHFAQNLNRIRFNGPRELDVLDHIKPSFSQLDFRDVRLRSL